MSNMLLSPEHNRAFRPAKKQSQSVVAPVPVPGNPRGKVFDLEKNISLAQSYEFSGPPPNTKYLSAYQLSAMKFAEKTD